MKSKPKNTTQLGFYTPFEEQLDHHHGLYILAKVVNWQLIEEAFSELYSDQVYQYFSENPFTQAQIM